MTNVIGSLYATLSIGAALAATGLAAYTFFKSARKDLAIRFAFWTLVIALIDISDGLRKLYAQSDDPTSTLFWTKLTVLGGIVFIPAFAEFCLSFPPKLEPIRSIIVSVAVATAAFLAAFLPGELLVKGLLRTPIGYSADFGKMILFFGPAFAIFNGVAFVMLIKKTWRKAPYYRKYFSIFGGIMVAGVLMNLVPPIQQAIYAPSPISILSVAAVATFSALVLKQRFLIVALAENSLPTPMKEELAEGRAYMFYSEDANKAFQIFVDHVNHGYAGLGITRSHPDTLRKELKLIKTPVLWMSEMDVENTIHPKDLGSMRFYIRSFCEGGRKRIVFIQGLEYIIGKNGMKKTLKLIQQVNDYIVANRAILAIALSGYLLGRNERAMLETQMTFVS